MTRRVAAVLLAAGVLVASTSCSSGDPGSTAAAGERYRVTAQPADPVEVRVTSGAAETVTLAAVMADMGHALPPVGTVQAGPGRFVATQDVFVMDGVWDLAISLTGDRGFEVITVSVQVGRVGA